MHDAERDCQADDPASAEGPKTTSQSHASGEGPRGDQVRDQEHLECAEGVKGPHIHPTVAFSVGFFSGVLLCVFTVWAVRSAVNRALARTLGKPL